MDGNNSTKAERDEMKEYCCKALVLYVKQYIPEIRLVTCLYLNPKLTTTKHYS